MSFPPPPPPPPLLNLQSHASYFSSFHFCISHIPILFLKTGKEMTQRQSLKYLPKFPALVMKLRHLSPKLTILGEGLTIDNNCCLPFNHWPILPSSHSPILKFSLSCFFLSIIPFSNLLIIPLPGLNKIRIGNTCLRKRSGNGVWYKSLKYLHKFPVLVMKLRHLHVDL